MSTKQGKTICVDFDGVINDYRGWKGIGNFELPVENCKYALEQLVADGWTIIVHTCRFEVELVAKYMDSHQLPYHYINCNPENIEQTLSMGKPLADIYLDDKAINFNGDWNTAIKRIMVFESWLIKRERKEQAAMRPDCLHKLVCKYDLKTCPSCLYYASISF